MSIDHVSRNRLFKFSESKQSFQPGQIIQGKILKLYPNNRAQIQLGSKVMVAQLEASLLLGEKYFLQVEAASEVIRLKVIGEQLQSQSQSSITDLIRSLGFKASKTNTNLAQMLINEGIPFEREQLARAFRLLESVGNKPKAQHILKEIITQKIPLTNSVFQALYIKETTELTDQMNALLKNLRQHQNPTMLQRNLINQISEMTEHPLSPKNALITQIIDETINNSGQTYNVLKTAGIIGNHIDLQKWTTEWKAFSEHHNITRFNASNQRISGLEIPFPLDIDKTESVLRQLQTSRNDIQTESQKFIQKWTNLINEIVIKNIPLSEQNFTQIKQEITQRIAPFLESEQIQNNPVSLRQLLTNLQSLSNGQIYANMEEILLNLEQRNALNLLSPKDQFLGELRQMLLSSGVTHENLLAQNMFQQDSSTIKSLLIQLVQQNEGVGNDQAKQLLHFINGMQLQSINETSNFIQASIQIPGEKLSLNNDLYLDFESKKTDDGKISADYCRILFYLDLTQLDETIIDMRIQKRLVSITIFNDNQDRVLLQTKLLQPLLHKGLAELNYQLATVSVKPLQEMKSHKQRSMPQVNDTSLEGIDYRI